jgi:dihydroflavonol-4-reductase
MKPTLVTGASGFLGWHVARVLLERGHHVRALVRPGSRVDAMDVEPVIGDLRDADSLARAATGCSLVFHVAADYRLWAKDPRELYRSNVDGTRNLLEAARRAGVERVVYTSTVGCIGIPQTGIGNEDTPVTLDDMAGDYKRSKFQAEQIALEFARTGLPVVVVNPTAPIGDHDVKPTPTGKIVLDFLKGDMPAFIDTGLNVVDVRDTAEGHWLACERGKIGERYILGAENLTLAQILEKLAHLTSRKAPSVRLPYAVAYCAGACSTAWANLTGTAPRVPMDAVRMARKKMWVTHEKARRELGFNPGPADQALARAVEWFSGSGRLPRVA